MLSLCLVSLASSSGAQETDITQTPNAAGAGIQKSLAEEVGAGRGDILTPASSAYVIARDPFRAIARGRQLFQRKFTHGQGLGPRTSDGEGDIMSDGSLGAGLSDSCAACHGRPQGAAGFGGDVFTRPTSRDAPHHFGLGLQEMLADEITRDLRAIRSQAVATAASSGVVVDAVLTSKGIDYGDLSADPAGSVDTSGVRGVDSDLRVRPFFAEGTTISIREFAVGAFNAEMGLESPDPDLLVASAGSDVVTPAGMRLTGSLDAIEAPPARSVLDDPDDDGVRDEIPTSLVDFMEFYLLNYFRPAQRVEGPGFSRERRGLHFMDQIGCTACHVEDLAIESDRRVADVHTGLDRTNGNPFNNLFAVATPFLVEVDDGSGHPTRKLPALGPFRVRGIFADFRRHDLGPNFWERNFDGSLQKEFMTEPLWGVGSTAPYGHDGRSPTLEDVILRHGGEAAGARARFAALRRSEREDILALLRSLVLFSPPATASNLKPADLTDPEYPVFGHGSIDLSVLFNDPSDKE